MYRNPRRPSKQPQTPFIPNKQMRKPKFPLVILQKYLLKSTSTFPALLALLYVPTYPPAQISGNLKQGLLAYRSDLHTHTSLQAAGSGSDLAFPPSKRIENVQRDDDAYLCSAVADLLACESHHASYTYM
jgi:hypothetical protein